MRAPDIAGLLLGVTTLLAACSGDAGPTGSQRGTLAVTLNGSMHAATVVLIRGPEQVTPTAAQPASHVVSRVTPEGVRVGVFGRGDAGRPVLQFDVADISRAAEFHVEVLQAADQRGVLLPPGHVTATSARIRK